MSGIGIDASLGNIDAHQDISHSQHLTSTPLRSVGDTRSKQLQPATRGRIYSPSMTPSPVRPEIRKDSQNSTTKKISQGSDCTSFADSGIACDRTDSTFEYDITGESYSKEGRRTQR